MAIKIRFRINDKPWELFGYVLYGTFLGWMMTMITLYLTKGKLGEHALLFVPIGSFVGVLVSFVEVRQNG